MQVEPNITQKDLNKCCPFHDRSTRHYLNQGEEIDLLESEWANRKIKEAIDTLYAHMAASGEVGARPIPISEYNIICQKSNQSQAHSPASFSEVYPLARDRSAESKLEKIISFSEHPFTTFLIQHYTDYRANGCSAKKAAFKTLGDFKKSIILGVSSTSPKIANENVTETPQSEQPLLIDENLKSTIILFENVQGSVESDSEIESINNSKNIIPVAELLLGLQIAICEAIRRIKAKDPVWFKANSIAFSEIATTNINGDIVPSSRFLKILIHNLSEYFIKEDDKASPDKILQNSITFAVRDGIFNQKVIVFKKTGENEFIIADIIDKVCPARQGLLNLITHLLNLRLLNRSI